MSQSDSARAPDGARASADFASTPIDLLIPTAQLSLRDRRVMVLPSATAGKHSMEFPLPLIPRSVIDQLIASCRWFWQRHRRCVGFVLIWEPDKGPWAAMIPAQRCSDDSACWSALLRDLPDFNPSSLMMGSFQSRILRNGETVADCPPPYDGVHFVLNMG